MVLTLHVQYLPVRVKGLGLYVINIIYVWLYIINIIYVRYGTRLVASWPRGHADLATVYPHPNKT